MMSAADGSASEEPGGPPEAVLQLALDLTALGRAADLVAQLSPALSRIEVGTPLALAAGLAAIDRIRPLSRPGAVIVADVKICDAGEKIARSAFAAGADVVTVVAAAIDEITWRGVLTAAADRGRGDGGPAPVVVDTVGGPPDPVALGALAATAAEAGVPVDLCLHRPKTSSPGFAELIRPLYGHRLGFDQLAVAGKLVPAEVRPALEAGFGTLVVGSAVTDADSPVAVWDAFRAKVLVSLVPALQRRPDVRVSGPSLQIAGKGVAERPDQVDARVEQPLELQAVHGGEHRAHLGQDRLIVHPDGLTGVTGLAEMLDARGHDVPVPPLNEVPRRMGGVG
jgi:3-keto-L-gulonate-6-phosphate decarboxylase